MSREEDLELAKRLYMSYGCNGFHMSREESDETVQWYLSLNIPDELSRSWMNDHLNKQLEKFHSIESCRELYHAYDDIVELAECSRRSDTWDLIVEMTRQVTERLIDPLYKVMVAETLVGRSEHPEAGFIAGAHRAGDQDACRGLIRAVLLCVSSAEAKEKHLWRGDLARKKAQSLSARLLGEAFALPTDGAKAILYLVQEEREVRLIDPTPEEAAEQFRLLGLEDRSAWDSCTHVALVRLPSPGMQRGDEVRVGLDCAQTDRLEVRWDRVRTPKDEVRRAWVTRPEVVIEIVLAALADDQTRLLAAVEWQIAVGPRWIEDRRPTAEH